MTQQTTNAVVGSVVSAAEESILDAVLAATVQATPDQDEATVVECPVPLVGPTVQPPVVDATEAAKQAAAQEEAARDEADGVLKAAIKAYRKGEKAYAAGLLESGRLTLDYIVRRAVLGDTRSSAVKTVEGELSRWSSTTVDANKLVRAYHAFHLLAESQPEVTDQVPYGTYRDHYSRLVESVDMGKATEHWILLPGVEEQAKECWAHCTKNGLSRDAVGVAINAVCKVAADKREAATKAVAADKRAVQDAQNAVLQAAKAEADKLAAERDAQQEAAKQATDEATKAALTQGAAESQAALLLKQRTLVEAAAKLNADTKAADEAAKRAAAAEKAKQDAAAKELAAANKAAEKAAAKEAGQTEARPPSAAAMAKVGTSKDVVGMMLELLEGCDEPDTVAELFAAAVVGSKEVTKVTKAAYAAAVAVYLAKAAKPVVTAANRTVAIQPPVEAHRLASEVLNGQAAVA